MITYQAGMKVEPSNANLLVLQGLVGSRPRATSPRQWSSTTKALEIDEKCEFAYETLCTIGCSAETLKRACELFDKAILCPTPSWRSAHLFTG